MKSRLLTLVLVVAFAVALAAVLAGSTVSILD
jgi:hypothetical protein